MVIPAIEDSYVYSRPGCEDTNFNNHSGWADSDIYIGQTNSGQDDWLTRSYIKFMVPQLPEGLSYANLNMEACFSGGASNVEVHYCSNDSWNESSLTWNNQPNISTFTLLDTISVDGNGAYSWDIASALANETDNHLTFMLRNVDDAYPTQVFFASETWNETRRPHIEYAAPVPEPATTAMFRIGGAGWFIRRRRKKR